MGRVAREKLTKATQLRLEAVKESRQRSNFTAAILWVLLSNLCFQPRNWAGVCRFSDSCDSLVYFGQSLLISWFSCFSRTSSLLCSLMSNGRFGPNLGILSDLASCSQERSEMRAHSNRRNYMRIQLFFCFLLISIVFPLKNNTLQQSEKIHLVEALDNKSTRGGPVPILKCCHYPNNTIMLVHGRVKSLRHCIETNVYGPRFNP